MKTSFVYDKAKYHYGGDYPKDLSPKQAFVHTGLFLGWLIDNNLYNQNFIDEKSVIKFKNREVTGPELFETELDGTLIEESLSEEGNKFAQYYFNFENGKYLKDYSELLSAKLPTMYHVKDTWNNYEKLSKKIDQRYADWKNKKNKKLWEFWK